MGKPFFSPPNADKVCDYSGFKTTYYGASVVLVAFSWLGTELDPLMWIMFSIGHTW